VVEDHRPLVDNVHVIGSTAVPDSRIDLSSPPELAAVNRGVHGVRTDVESYRLPELWQLHLYEYSARLLLDGVEHAVTPGTISVTPPGVTSRMHYRGRSEHLYSHFRAPRSTQASGVPVVLRAGSELPELTALMRSAVAHTRTRPARARADVWTLLLRLADRPGDDQNAAPDHVGAAMSWIEARLAEPFTVPAVAEAVGISHNHLTRVFRARTGGTVVAYVRRRRVEVAHHLLRSSTLSVASIAATVGFADLQTLNKACRLELGRAPTELRARSPR
jgi:AraC-like DNA-binding protein